MDIANKLLIITIIIIIVFSIVYRMSTKDVYK